MDWTFVPTHPKTRRRRWRGWASRRGTPSSRLLDEAIADKKAQVRVVAYDLSEPDVVSRLEKLGKRLKIIIDDSAAHGKPHSAETQAAERSRPRPVRTT